MPSEPQPPNPQRRIRTADLLHLATLCETHPEGAVLYLVWVEHKHGTDHYLYPDLDTAVRTVVGALTLDNEDEDCRWDREEGAALLSSWNADPTTKEHFPDKPGTHLSLEQLEQYNQRLAPFHELLADWGELTGHWWAFTRIPLYLELPRFGPGTLYAALDAATRMESLARTLSEAATAHLHQMTAAYQREALTRESLYPEEADLLREIEADTLLSPGRLFGQVVARTFILDSLRARKLIEPGPGILGSSPFRYVLTEKGKKCLEASSPPAAPESPSSS